MACGSQATKPMRFTSNEDVVVKRHPLRVRPMGSRLLSDAPHMRELAGALGSLGALPDEVLLPLLGLLDVPSLARCARTSRAMRVLALSDDIWKAHCLEELPDGQWLRYDARGWRYTYALLFCDAARCVKDEASEGGDEADGTVQGGSTAICGTAAALLAAGGPLGSYYYSDMLYASWQCGTATIPVRWSVTSTIERVSAANLSVEEFEARFESAGRPVILTGLVDTWPASTRWSEPALRARFGNHVGFHVGGHTMGLCDFLDYCRANTDEQPLYLFDKRFCETSAGGDASTETASTETASCANAAAPASPAACPHAASTASAACADASAGTAAASAGGLGTEYTVPPYFAPERDLFEALPPLYRPDHRWLIIGGTRSGSSWHVDPNGSAAWNACVAGRKKWILCPPHAPPPGVTASADGTSVTSPISLYEWFRVFYSSLEEQRERSPPMERPLEATVGAGELLFVPAGWWHCCLNLEGPTIALTQNYVPRCLAASVLRYLRGTGDAAEHLVSGISEELRPHLADQFAAVLARLQPQALEEAAMPPPPSDDDDRGGRTGRRAAARREATAPKVMPPATGALGAAFAGGADATFSFSFA